jgi:hemerythrin-like domain-containing protein
VDRAGDRSTPPVPDDWQLLEEAVAAIDEEVNQHFGFDESILFPLIADRGAGDMTRLLTQEHAVISPLGIRLSEGVVGALKCGIDDPGWSEFREVAQELVDRVTFHLQKEEMGLIQRLPLFFAPETDRRLADQYAERRTAERSGASPLYGSPRPMAAKQVGKHDRTSAE